MFSKLATRVTRAQQLTTAMPAAAFATSKKPSIGDAVTILQSKVSGINQVVSTYKTRNTLLLLWSSPQKRRSRKRIMI